MVDSNAAVTRNALLRMTGITKLYPGVIALADADFDVQPGEIHGLVGKNGAGKSTLMGVLTGIRPPDSGEIEVDGERLKDVSPSVMLNAGIAYVPQHIKMLNTLSVAENILAGNLPKNRFGLVRWGEVYRECQSRLDKLGLKLNAHQPVEGLTMAEKTLLAIAKALFSNARLIILDEPTAVLNRQEVELLFSFVRSLREQGTSFVYISHHLEEIFEICDRVTVMRDGRVIETLQVPGLTIDRLINSMVGESVREYWRDSTIEPEEVFCASNLSRRGAYDNVNLLLKKGEVVGLCGLGGSGVGELARALFGMERRGVGEVTVNGEPLTATTPKAAFTQGIAYLPDDRQRFGIVSLRPVRENITYSVLDHLANWIGIVPSNKERATTSSFIDQLGIVTPSQDQLAGLLSGGNQQKVVFAKLAATKPAVLILHEPTQGVDVRAKVDIFDIISELSAKGVAILIISSEVRELSGLCDRILVMYEGRITREFDRTQGELSPQEILLAIEGGERETQLH